MTKIAIVDDLVLVAETLAEALKSKYGEHIHAYSPENLDHRILRNYDLLLLDFDFGALGNANDLLNELERLEITDLKIILFSSFWKPQVLMVCRHPLVLGYFNKTYGLVDSFAAIDAVLAGKRWYQPQYAEEIKRLMKLPKSQVLTNRENEIVGLLQQGYSKPEVATELGISINTVRNHVTHIFEKLGVNSIRQL
ncbi:MAG: hypothetical protein CL840_14425 [Crocinitomicaceae bacterium]|nr:hypothetical protein [Crocinitomicaceae bacterium]|tara:strand:- start:1272 stop:1856 length:585 start_codon:yes stop_codon:yes gene_type:complete